MNGRPLFLARLVPCERTVRIREPGVGVAAVKISRSALDAQRPVVGSVPVLLAHDDKRIVGRVLGLTTAAGWWVATLDIDPGANELVRVGTAVSVGLDLEETSRSNEWSRIERVASATLREVSLAARGMVEGACITAILHAKPKKSIVVSGVELRPGEELLDARGGVIVRCGVDSRGGAVLVR